MPPLPQQPHFTPPDGAETYFRDVTSRCEDLIRTRIWEGIETDHLRDWLKNFAGSQQTYFAARLLDALIYRSDAQTAALMVQQFQRILPDLSHRAPTPLGVIDDWMYCFSHATSDPGMRIVPVIHYQDPPTKSGPLVCRLLKRKIGLNDRWMIWPWLSELKRSYDRGIRIFLFVDDFLGTGYQFTKFFRPIYDVLAPLNVYMAYSPLAAFDRGVAKVKARFPRLHVTPVECLDHSHCLFHDASLHFNDGINTPASAKRFYLDFSRATGLSSLGSITLGYSKLGMAFAFHHATPNASLPIFWSERVPLKPLVAR